MQLTAEHINKFKIAHNGELDGFTENEIRQIAQGVANYYLALFGIIQKSERQKNGTHQ